MNAKEYLRQYSKLNKDCKLLSEEINSLKEDYELISIITDGIHSSKIGKPTEAKAIKVANLEEKYSKMLEERQNKRKEIFNVIMNVGGIEAELLYKRYIESLEWEEICTQLHYGRSNTYKLHGTALKMVSRIINKGSNE